MTYSIGPDEVPRLRDEHFFLERQLLSVIQLAQAGQSCMGAWEAFARDLQEHMRYQESLLFPTFAQSGADLHSWAAGFIAEHQDLRRRCQILGSALMRSPRDLDPLRQLARNLSDHKERESLVLFPWLTSLTPPRASWETKAHNAGVLGNGMSLQLGNSHPDLCF